MVGFAHVSASCPAQSRAAVARTARTGHVADTSASSRASIMRSMSSSRPHGIENVTGSPVVRPTPGAARSWSRLDGGLSPASAGLAARALQIQCSRGFLEPSYREPGDAWAASLWRTPGQSRTAAPLIEPGRLTDARDEGLQRRSSGGRHAAMPAARGRGAASSGPRVGRHKPRLQGVTLSGPVRTVNPSMSTDSDSDGVSCPRYETGPRMIMGGIDSAAALGPPHRRWTFSQVRALPARCA